MLQDLDLDLDQRAAANSPDVIVSTSRYLEAALVCEANAARKPPLIAILDRDEPEPAPEQRARCRFLVRRPVHSVVLRLLVQRVLHRGVERRRRPRAILGVPALLCVGERSWQATLLDLSMRVARLTLPAELRPGIEIQLRVPAASSGLDDEVELTGRVIRVLDPTQRGGDDPEFAVSFDTVEPSIRRDLRSLLVAVTARDVMGSGIHPGPDLSRPADEPGDRQVGVGGARVLVGSELSLQGMRVDRGEFREGDRLTLSLYGGASVPACSVEASVERVDALGCRLQFLGMPSEVSETLARLMSSGDVSRGCAAGSEPVVVSEWLH